MTRRIEQLEAVVAECRRALARAEAALHREKCRQPAIGDYVRCPLTNFFGQVTKVIPRRQGRPWVEITPYLTDDLPGQGTMDLYDSWELIDPPGEGAQTGSGHPDFPPISTIEWPSKARGHDLHDEAHYFVRMK